MLSLVVLAGCGQKEAPPRSLLLGLDGTDWRNVVPLMRQGKMPTMDALVQAGTRATMLTNPDFRWSPVIWTSVATGKLPEKHGVTSFMARVPEFERMIPTPSTERKVRALWNMFTEHERTVGFVGWWVTWPAEPVNGFMISDHFSVSRFDLGRDYEKDRRDQYFEGQTFPEDLAARLAPHKFPRENVGREELEPFAHLPADYVFPAKFAKFDQVAEFAIAHSVDRTHFGAGEALLRDVQPDLFGLFFQGIDIMQHYFWEYLDPDQPYWTPTEAELERFGESIELYHGWIDERVADLIAAGGDRAVLLVSDHGFRPANERYEEKNISGEHRRQAFWLHAGPGVRRGEMLTGADAVDVTPTILAYHGLPVANDFDGEPLDHTFTDDWQDAHPVEFIETYELGDWKPGDLPTNSAADGLADRIRAIGYID